MIKKKVEIKISRTTFKKELHKIKSSTEDKGYIEGYASLFDTEDLEGLTIQKGAYDAYLSSGELPVLCFNHVKFRDDCSAAVGKILSLSVDDTGLFMTAKVNPEHKIGKELIHSLVAGDMSGISIAGHAIAYEDENGNLIAIQIFLEEISLCDFPCLPNARVSLAKSCTKVSADKSFFNDLEDDDDEDELDKSVITKEMSDTDEECEDDEEEEAETALKIASMLAILALALS